MGVTYDGKLVIKNNYSIEPCCQGMQNLMFENVAKVQYQSTTPYLTLAFAPSNTNYQARWRTDYCPFCGAKVTLESEIDVNDTT